MPEWYNPSYAKIPGAYFNYGQPTNPYTGKKITYTGYIDKKDFINEVQVPQMEELAYNYETEMMWCDLGGPNNSPKMLSKWINWARKANRQVTFNSRCGQDEKELPGDFATPE